MNTKNRLALIDELPRKNKRNQKKIHVAVGLAACLALLCAFVPQVAVASNMPEHTFAVNVDNLSQEMAGLDVALNTPATNCGALNFVEFAQYAEATTELSGWLNHGSNFAGTLAVPKQTAPRSLANVNLGAVDLAAVLARSQAAFEAATPSVLAKMQEAFNRGVDHAAAVPRMQRTTFHIDDLPTAPLARSTVVHSSVVLTDSSAPAPSWHIPRYAQT